MIEKLVSRAWYEDQAWIRLLAPLSKLYLREHEKRKHLAVVKRRIPFVVPVVVVGNITVGGTGKTPLIIFLANALRDRGVNVGVISRGYGGQPPQEPHRVSLEDDPAVCGDEPLLVAESTGVPVVVGKDRCKAVEMLLENDIQLVLSDDGLQHYALPRQYEIAVVDGERCFGNGRLLPAGPLREPLERLETVDFVLVNGADADLCASSNKHGFEVDASYQMKPSGWINVQTGTRVPLDFVATNENEADVHAIAGIGNPKRFFDSLEDLGICAKEHIFPDHHRFSKADFSFIDSIDTSTVLMTTKDALKCRKFAGPNFWALETDLVFGFVSSNDGVSPNDVVSSKASGLSGQNGGHYLLDELQKLLP